MKRLLLMAGMIGVGFGLVMLLVSFPNVHSTKFYGGFFLTMGSLLAGLAISLAAHHGYRGEWPTIIGALIGVCTTSLVGYQIDLIKSEELTQFPFAPIAILYLVCFVLIRADRKTHDLILKVEAFEKGVEKPKEKAAQTKTAPAGLITTEQARAEYRRKKEEEAAAKNPSPEPEG